MSESYEVRVQIGDSLVRTVGALTRATSGAGESPFVPSSPSLSSSVSSPFYGRFNYVEFRYMVMGGCAVSAGVFASLLVCFGVLKRHQHRQLRQLKRMQSEFEDLEMRVARECKEAFTELQMDIGQFASSLHQTGPPFNSFQTFCMRVMFPHAGHADKYLLTAPVDLLAVSSSLSLSLYRKVWVIDSGF